MKGDFFGQHPQVEKSPPPLRNTYILTKSDTMNIMKPEIFVSG